MAKGGDKRHKFRQKNYLPEFNLKKKPHYNRCQNNRVVPLQNGCAYAKTRNLPFFSFFHNSTCFIYHVKRSTFEKLGC